MSSIASDNRKGSGRAGLIYGLVSLALLASLIPALHPPRPPVPPTAAYAPEAAQNPQQAPNNQSSVNGKGNAGRANNGVPNGAPTPTPTPATQPGSGQGPVVPRYLDCVATPPGYPPRQVLDTQSPPCIASWQGNNGGSTYPGVTKTTIYIDPGGDDCSSGGEFASYLNWANDHFQFYGRKIACAPSTGGCAAGGQSDMTASFQHDANKAISSSTGVFASTDYCDEGGQEKLYYDDLARAGIVSVSDRPDIRTEADYAGAGGNPWYEWNYLQSFDNDQRDLAALACDQLANRAAPAYAQQTPNQTRKFGVIYSYLPDIPASDTDYNGEFYRTLIDDLARCGVNVPSADVRGIKYVTGTQSTGYQNYDQQSLQDAQQAAVQFKQDQVTTIITIAHSEDTLETMEGADNIGHYSPEWVLSPFFYDVTYPLEPNPPQDQWIHAFGFDYLNRMEAVQDSTWYWPLIEENPSYTANPYVPERYYGLIFQYYEILMLASGIQMAGPDLTPQSFADGLWKTQFPNPPSPYSEGKVGFSDDHTMLKDLTLEWYSPSTPGPWGGQQASWCFIENGQRYRTVSANGNGQDPPLTNAPAYPFFSGTCDP